MSKSLTDCLRDIGEEQVTIKINGQEYTCSRTEATARKMILMANGGFEEITNEEGETMQIAYKADAKVAKMVREFVDGKAASEPPKAKEKGAKAGQYDSEISRRLNERLGPQSKPRVPVRPKKPEVPGVSFQPKGIDT